MSSTVERPIDSITVKLFRVLFDDGKLLDVTSWHDGSVMRQPLADGDRLVIGICCHEQRRAN